MDFFGFKLHFNAPLHIGSGTNQSYDKSEKLLHSDTILSALYSTAQKWYGEDYKLSAQEFFDTYSISSAFPFENNTLFFPKPYIKLNLQIDGLDDKLFAKTAKKLEWIAKPYFEDLIDGKNVKANINELSKNKKYLGAGNGYKVTSLFTEQKLNKIDQLTEGKDPTPYYLERIFFDKHCGLFFLCKCKLQQANQLESLLKMLGDEGIGTDRHNGNGTFTAEKFNVSLKTPNATQHWLNLSLYCPNKNDLDTIDLVKSSYKLKKRGGYIAGSSNNALRTFRKKSIYMFTEGNVLCGKTQPVGYTPNLAPDQIDQNITGALHPVLRSGRAITIPIKGTA